MKQELQTGDNRLLRMEVSEYKGETYIHMAHLWRRSGEGDQDWKYSKQVINVPVDKKEEFATAITNLLQSI